MDCNTTQNEQAGKDYVLKICKAIDNATVAIGTANDPEAILKAAHGLQVGDLVEFDSVPGSVSEISTGVIYFVKSVPSSGSFKISTTLGGAAITFTDTIADLDLKGYSSIGGLRSNGLALAAEGIETTNYGSNQWRTFKSGAGIKSASISGEGVISNEANYELLETNFLAQTLVCLAFCNITTGKIRHGCFKITSLEETAEYSGEATYSAAFESSGQIYVKAAV